MNPIQDLLIDVLTLDSTHIPFIWHVFLFFYCLFVNIIIIKEEYSNLPASEGSNNSPFSSTIVLTANSFAYNYIYSCFRCLGGSIMVPMIIGKPLVPLMIDELILFTFITHWILNNKFSPFETLRNKIIFSKALDKTIPFVLCSCFFEVFRTGVLVSQLESSKTVLTRSTVINHYGLFGPIICGTIGGCGGAFLSGKRLDTIKEGPSWIIASAFTGAILYHLTTTTSAYHIHFGLTEPFLSTKHARAFISAFFVFGRLITPHRLYNSFVSPIESGISKLFGIPRAGDKVFLLAEKEKSS